MSPPENIVGRTRKNSLKRRNSHAASIKLRHRFVIFGEMCVLCAKLRRVELTKVEVETRGVMIPFFTGIGIGIGITTKGVGIGIAWNRLLVGIDSSSGIDSTTGIDSTIRINSPT